MPDKGHEAAAARENPVSPAQVQEDWIVHSRAFAERSSEILFLYSPDMQPLYANPAYEQIFGRSVEEWLTTGAAGDFAMIHLDDLGTVEETVSGLLSAVAKAEGQGEVLHGLSAEMTYRIRRPDGQVRTVRSRIFPVVADDRGVLGIGGIGTDVTAERATIDALVRARDEAREERLRMTRFQNRFVQEGLASHATWVEMIEGILSGRTTTTELLALSHQDTYILASMDELSAVDDLSLATDVIALPSLLAQVTPAVQRLTDRSDVTIASDIALPGPQIGPTAVIACILRGLIGFALLRVPRGGTIFVHATVHTTGHTTAGATAGTTAGTTGHSGSDGSTLTLRVTDDGPPIGHEDLSRLLLPLEQLPGEGRAGLRIGLALADAAAARIGGGVTVTPRTTDGAIVTCRIPLTPPVSTLDPTS